MLIKNLCVSYGQNAVYTDFNLQTDDKMITCILGESGCGKTTLLNAVAALIPYTGEISPVKISYVFQSPRLVPNLTVLGNLTLIGAQPNEAKAMLESVGLGEKLNAYPNTLSGGERQRVALSRAFLYPAELILMDEPFSSLDLKTKLAAMDLYKTLQEKSGIGAIFVTHDIDEALYLSDRIIVLNKGSISADFNDVPRTPFATNSELRGKIVETLLK